MQHPRICYSDYEGVADRRSVGDRRCFHLRFHPHAPVRFCTVGIILNQRRNDPEQLRAYRKKIQQRISYYIILRLLSAPWRSNVYEAKDEGEEEEEDQELEVCCVHVASSRERIREDRASIFFCIRFCMQSGIERRATRS